MYDGDTITIATFLYDNPYRFSVRLNGIDTPEMKITSEKDRAIIARDELRKRVMNQIVTLRNISLEKYGRILADVYLGDECMNTWMLDHGYAKPYHGGHKESWI